MSTLEVDLEGPGLEACAGQRQVDRRVPVLHLHEQRLEVQLPQRSQLEGVADLWRLESRRSLCIGFFCGPLRAVPAPLHHRRQRHTGPLELEGQIEAT